MFPGAGQGSSHSDNQGVHLGVPGEMQFSVCLSVSLPLLPPPRQVRSLPRGWGFPGPCRWLCLPFSWGLRDQAREGWGWSSENPLSLSILRSKKTRGLSSDQRSVKLSSRALRESGPSSCRSLDSLLLSSGSRKDCNTENQPVRGPEVEHVLARGHMCGNRSELVWPGHLLAHAQGHALREGRRLYRSAHVHESVCVCQAVFGWCMCISEEG